jgi:NADPH:quinone reductase-like Zn-dependent oxidoreductase
MGGLRRPRYPILGSDIAGRVEAVGNKHTEFKPGDEVFGELPGYRGGFAEFACTHGKTLMLKPASLSFEQAAAIPQGGVIALNGIRTKGDVQAGQHVLINGAGGSAGSFAIQLARLYGAEVTGVDHANKLDFVRSLGADHVIDYARQDFTRSGKQYDLVLDLIAYRPIANSARVVRPGGTYFFVGGSLRVLVGLLLQGPFIGRTTGKKLRLLVVSQNRRDLIAITELCQTGQIAPVIDREFPLVETPEAFKYMLSGRANGKIVITVTKD